VNRAQPAAETESVAASSLEALYPRRLLRLGSTLGKLLRLHNFNELEHE
jgi:hypothetical protein